MKSKITLSIIAAISALISTSCTRELASEADDAPVKIESVTMRAHDFEIADNHTKTTLTIDEKLGAKFSWSADDIVGVFPDLEEASQVKFPIKDGNVSEGEATSSANFTGNGWAVMEARKYMSYYPFKPDMNLNMKAIPVIYTGQSQVLNNNPAGIFLYDYMAAAPTKPSFNGHIGFNFKHMNALLVIDLKVPKPGKYSSLTLTCDDVPFVTEGSLDITSDDPAIKPVITNRSLTLNIGGIELTAANEKLRTFMMIAPMNAAGKNIQIRLEGPNADFTTSVTGSDYLAGKTYKVEVNDIKGGDVIQLAEGRLFNERIKSLANGEQYILDKKDYKIKNIVFKANANGTVPSLPHVDVSSTGSSSPIYASWDAETGTILVDSPSYKVYANENADGMFKNLACLDNVSFTDFSTNYSTSLSSMFEGCERMAAIDISSFEISSVHSVRGLFSGCEKLIEIVWPKMTFSKDGIDISEMFNNCKQLTSIDLQCFNECKIDVATNTFGSCSSLKSIDLSKMDFSTCGGLYGIFANCSSLTTLDVSNFGWKNINGGDWCWPFAGCTSLKEINLGDFYIPKANRLDLFFSGCSSLEKIECTRFDINAGNVSNFFNGCSSLKSVNVDNFVTSQTTLIDGVFSGCSSLESVELSHWNTSSVTNMSGLFDGCSKLKSLDLSSFNTSAVTNMDGMFSGCSSIQALDLSSFETYNVTSMQSLFDSCTSLTQIIFGDGFNTEKVTNMRGLFSRCKSMETIDLSKFSTSVVLNFDVMFDGCSSLKVINWGKNFDTHYAESFEGMFNSCVSLESLDLSLFNTISARNLNGMFNECDNLKYLNLSSFTSEHLKDNTISNMLCGCRNLSELHLGSKFNPTKLNYTFSRVASNIEGKCVVYCSETFMNNFSKDETAADCLNPTKVTWINCDTGNEMTFPAAN